MLTYTIKCCGPSKDYFNDTKISISTVENMTSSILKKRLLKYIKPSIDETEAAELLNACVIASDEKVLASDAILSHSTPLFLLPPVCGG